jgi:hypothetical protein
MLVAVEILPDGGHPLFVATVASFILIFGVAGELPVAAPVAGAGDLVFGVLFAAWLASAWRLLRQGSRAREVHA